LCADCRKNNHRENIIQNAYISFKLNKWFLVAWLVPPLLAIVTFFISLLFPGVSYSPGMYGTAGLSIMIIRGGKDLTVGASGMVGFIALILVIAGFYWYDAYISKEKFMQREIDDLWDSDKYQLQ
jgi:hypothetical protein